MQRERHMHLAKPRQRSDLHDRLVEPQNSVTSLHPNGTMRHVRRLDVNLRVQILHPDREGSREFLVPLSLGELVHAIDGAQVDGQGVDGLTRIVGNVYHEIRRGRWSRKRGHAE